MPQSLHNLETICTTIVRFLCRELKMAATDIQLDLPLTQYGLDSIAALTIAGELEDQFELELPSTLLWDCPTINDLANFLHETLHARDTVAEQAC